MVYKNQSQVQNSKKLQLSLSGSKALKFLCYHFFQQIKCDFNFNPEVKMVLMVPLPVNFNKLIKLKNQCPHPHKYFQLQSPLYFHLSSTTTIVQYLTAIIILSPLFSLDYPGYPNYKNVSASYQCSNFMHLIFQLHFPKSSHLNKQHPRGASIFVSVLLYFRHRTETRSSFFTI